MKDQRLAFLRGVLDALVESLDATARISRWQSTDSVPEPLQQSAAKLMERLGQANRLAADKFAGPPVAVARMTDISGAIRRLDLAYVTYRQRLAGSPAQRDEAAVTLDAEIGVVRADAHRWA